MVAVSRRKILHPPAQTLLSCPSLIDVSFHFLHYTCTRSRVSLRFSISPSLLPHLEVGHVSVALLGARVIRQLDVPEAGQLVHQEGVLFDHSVKDVLQSTRPTSHIPLHQLQTDLAALMPPTHFTEKKAGKKAGLPCCVEKVSRSHV